MLVQQILKAKGSNHVETMGADATLADATRLLSGKKIGALLVTRRDGQIAGILSERDIVGAIGKAGCDALEDTVAQHMTRDVVVATPDETAARVMERMTAGRFRHMPVVENDSLAGIISIGDVVKARIDETERENTELQRMVAGAVA